MGKVILCSGARAKHAYHFKSTGISVSTIEELCYYILHNIETVGVELMEPELVSFMREELFLPERAELLERLISTHCGLKDVIVTILCSADYCEENEIKEVLAQLDYLNDLTPLQRKKRKADHFLTNGQNREALACYRDIVYSRDNAELNSVEYGDIMHNIALLYARAGAFGTAADNFREAYERNHNEDSLRQYLYALKLGHQEQMFDKELQIYSSNKGLTERIEAELLYVADTEENTYEFHEVDKLRQMKEEGRISEYCKLTDELMERFKNKYRTENG